MCNNKPVSFCMLYGGLSSFDILYVSKFLVTVPHNFHKYSKQLNVSKWDLKHLLTI